MGEEREGERDGSRAGRIRNEKSDGRFGHFRRGEGCRGVARDVTRRAASGVGRPGREKK